MVLLKKGTRFSQDFVVVFDLSGLLDDLLSVLPQLTVRSRACVRACVRSWLCVSQIYTQAKPSRPFYQHIPNDSPFRLNHSNTLSLTLGREGIADKEADPSVVNNGPQFRATGQDRLHPLDGSVNEKERSRWRVHFRHL